MCLSIIYGSKTKQATAHLLSKMPEDSRLLIVEIDDRIPRNIVPEQTRFRTYEDYLSENDLESIDQKAADFAKGWYVIDGKDWTSYKGLSLGSIRAADLFLKMVLVFKNLELALHIIEKEKIKKIFVGEGVSLVRWVWKVVGQSKDISILFLPIDSTKDFSLEQKTISLPKPKHVKNRFFEIFKLMPLIFEAFDYFVSQVYININVGRRTGNKRKKNNKMTLLVQEGRSTCEPWFSQLKNSDRFVILPLNKTVSIITDDLKLYFNIGKFTKDWLTYVEFAKKLPAFEYKGINIWQDMRSILKEYFEEFPNLAVDIGKLKRFLQQVCPRVIILPWHALGRLISSLSKELDIPLIVLQDSWLPGKDFPGGFRRCISCDHIFVWGKISAGWCTFCQPSHVHLMGNPRSTTLKEKKGIWNSKRKKEVLFTHQCWGPWSAFHSPLDTNDMFSAFAETAKKMLEIRFIIKVHPLVNHPTHEWPGRSKEIMDWVISQNLSNLSVSPLNSSMAEVFPSVGIVVTYYSLTAVEALMQGKLVIMMNLTKKRDLFPELIEYGVALCARKSSELAECITRLLTDGDLVRKMQEARSRFIADVFAPPKNVEDELLAIIKNG